jgi:hypothetical protein
VALAVVASVVTLFGTVTRGPVTPVCRVDIPCDDPAANVKLSFSRAGSSISVRTDGFGRYRVRLAPGTYVVRSNAGMSIAPARVTIRGTTLRRNFSIDTGIR